MRVAGGGGGGGCLLTPILGLENLRDNLLKRNCARVSLGKALCARAGALGFMLVRMLPRVLTICCLVARGMVVEDWRSATSWRSWERLEAVGEAEPGLRRTEEDMKKL